MSDGSNLSPHARRDSFGCQVSSLSDDRHIASTSMDLYSKGSSSRQISQVLTPPSARGYVIGVSTVDGHRRRIFHEHHSTAHEMNEGSIYVRDMSERYKADLSGAFGFVLIEISSQALDRFAREADSSGFGELTRLFGVHDPVLFGLARAIFAAPAPSLVANSLFIDQLSTAIGIHIVGRYGNGRQALSDRRPALSRRQERLAIDLMLAATNANLSIAALAEACEMSQAAFLRAFRQSTGQSPHQWLVQQRLAQALELMTHSSLSLGEIASRCGFAHQSHFSRVFSQAKGMPPGAWRRLQQN